MSHMAKPPLPNPLNDGHLAQLNAALEATAWQEDILNRCKNCNLNVDKMVNDNQRAKDMALALKTHFFPHST